MNKTTAYLMALTLFLSLAPRVTLAAEDTPKPAASPAEKADVDDFFGGDMDDAVLAKEKTPAVKEDLKTAAADDDMANDDVDMAGDELK